MNQEEKEVITTDVLVVGAGSAGCRAALRARELGAKVTLVDKGPLGRSGASTFAHCMIAPVPAGAHSTWLEELVEQSEYLADQEWIELILKEQGDRVRELEKWGVPFEREPGGNLKYFPARGQIISRAINFNGLHMMDRLREVVRNSQVQIVERVMLTDLLTSDELHPTKGEIAGAIGIHTQTGKPFVFQARAVVIATGPFATKGHLGTYTESLTGEGPAMAFRAGAKLISMEMATHGAFNYVENKFRVIGQSKLQGMGARFSNRLGERVMEKYDPKNLEQSTFALICQALVKEVLEGRGPIYLDMRHFTSEQIETLQRILPETMKSLNESGIDIREQPLEIKPVANLCSTGPGAGIWTGLQGEASIPCLFSAGNASKIPQGVANWGGSPQAYAFVSGYRAGESAARQAASSKSNYIPTRQVESLIKQTLAPLKRKKGVNPDSIFYELNRGLHRAENFFFKSEPRIKRTLEKIRELQEEELSRVYARNARELVKANEARSALLLAELVYLSALHRRESRGPHYREDFPFRDDQNWLKWVVTYFNKAGIQVHLEPIPLERYTLKPKSREIIPHPVQFEFPERPPSVKISPILCNGCRICLDSCPVDVIKMNEQNKAYAAYPQDCYCCTLCEHDCPVGAIQVTAAHRIPPELLPY